MEPYLYIFLVCFLGFIFLFTFGKKPSDPEPPKYNPPSQEEEPKAVEKPK
jgi:hypothetical protein